MHIRTRSVDFKDQIQSQGQTDLSMRLSYNVYDPNNTQGKFTFDQNRGSHTQLPGGTASEAVEMLQCRADPACKDAAV